MPRTLRSRELQAAPEAVWELICDPHHLPRWWPAVLRVEGVGADAFTLVMRSNRGRTVRLDQRVTESAAPLRRAWAQQLQGTPFERLLAAWETSVTLEALPHGTRVTLEERQRLRGVMKLGDPLSRGPARRRVEAALDGLARLLEGP